MAKKLYEQPIEKRVRVKYLIFGLLLGITGITASYFIANVVTLVMRTMYPELPWQITYEFTLSGVGGFGLITAMFIPLLYSMWYSKKLSKSVEREPVGLKYDYERFKE